MKVQPTCRAAVTLAAGSEGRTVDRVKKGTPSTHPLTGRELRALRRLEREATIKSPFVFVSGRGAPLSTAGFARMLERAPAEARLEIKAHPHMLRHACGFTLANAGHDTRALQAQEYPAYGSLYGAGADAL